MAKQKPDNCPICGKDTSIPTIHKTHKKRHKFYKDRPHHKLAQSLWKSDPKMYYKVFGTKKDEQK